MKSVDEIKAVIAGMEVDIEKFERGNAAAGTRVRNALLKVKKLADAGRKEVTEAKS